MEQIKVFLDTDILISALLSKTGASSEVLKIKGFQKIISNTVKSELKEVCARLNISHREKLLKNIDCISLNLPKQRIIKNYLEYVFDEKDSHIIAAAVKSKSKFLLSYNIKDYKIDKIRNNFGIIVSKPGNFLQYLRSLGK